MVWNNQHLWANFQSINQLHFFHQICIFTYSIRTHRGSIIRNILEANIIKQLDAITTGWWWLLPRECHTIKNKREGKGTNVTRNRRRSYPQAWIASREMNWICGELVVKFHIRCIKINSSFNALNSDEHNIEKWATGETHEFEYDGDTVWSIFITKILSFHFMILAMGSISKKG